VQDLSFEQWQEHFGFTGFVNPERVKVDTRATVERRRTCFMVDVIFSLYILDDGACLGATPRGDFKETLGQGGNPQKNLSPWAFLSGWETLAYGCSGGGFPVGAAEKTGRGRNL
jgi:hypothetical protein